MKRPPTTASADIAKPPLCAVLWTAWRRGTALALTSIVASGALGAVTSEFAQVDAGPHEQLLVEVLHALQADECPASLMSDALAASWCPLDRGSPALEGLGRLEGTHFQGLWQSPGGPIELYEVEFTNASIAWQLGVDSGGKLVVLWSSVRAMKTVGGAPYAFGG